MNWFLSIFNLKKIENGCFKIKLSYKTFGGRRLKYYEWNMQILAEQICLDDFNYFLCEQDIRYLKNGLWCSVPVYCNSWYPLSMYTL